MNDLKINYLISAFSLKNGSLALFRYITFKEIISLIEEFKKINDSNNKNRLLDKNI